MGDRKKMGDVERAGATCRVYLLTCRRPLLLRRAVDSLLAQSRGDWVCELHNDAPEDRGPQQLVDGLRDPRIVCVNHDQNLGAIRSYNLAFTTVREPFATLLHDDNWWEPRFLARMIGSLERHPDVRVALGNQWHWREEANGEWRRLGTTSWPVGDGGDGLIDWPMEQQVLSASHSDASLLFRTGGAESLRLPDELPFEAQENQRDRLLPYPLLLVREPLLNYAVTRATSRGRDDSWTRIQVMMAASFFSHFRPPSASMQRYADSLRKGRPRRTHHLAAAALWEPRCRWVAGYLTPGDWLHFAIQIARHPCRYRGLLRPNELERIRWRTLDEGTAVRAETARQRGVVDFLPWG
jgi:glycosyltransferase involved in cell wall biosynthesis